MNFLPYAKQSINSADLEAVSESLKGDIITRGSHVEAFEQSFAAYCNAKYAVAFSSGTAGLMASYHAVKTGSNDRILTTPNTFVSSVGAGIQCGATPVFLDIDRSTGNLNLDQLECNIKHPSSRGKTIIVPVHFAGIPVDMQLIDSLIKDPETIVIEDAAHAIGSLYNDGNRVGCCSHSDLTVFSLHPAKNITSGEGGIVTTNNEDLFHSLRLFRNNGIERDPLYLKEEPRPWYYEVVELSGNYNFTDMQGALGLSQLKRIDQFAAKRRELLAAYRGKLAAIEHLRMFTSDYDNNAFFHLCVVQIEFEKIGKDRAALMNALKEKGIGTQVHYIPVYRHPFFRQGAGDMSDYFPEMEAYYAQALSLPFYYDLTLEDVDRVVQSLKTCLSA